MEKGTDTDKSLFSKIKTTSHLKVKKKIPRQKTQIWYFRNEFGPVWVRMYVFRRYKKRSSKHQNGEFKSTKNKTQAKYILHTILGSE